MPKYKRRKKPNYRGFILFLTAVLLVLGLMALGIHFRDTDPELKFPTDPTTVPTTVKQEPTTQPTEPTTEATEPPVTLVSTAKISAMGDMLMHLPCIEAAKTSDGYDFTPFFRYLQD